MSRGTTLWCRCTGVCEIEEEPQVSVPPKRPRMVDTQTSPMSSPTVNTSRRN
ncbi:hypothetical protein DPMN_180388 [Dreissena polymorpha]|uniref:Uncharacterized protein n=1 Tax=Dreissena polymorpha TaxID=45954 RepID=A0A9D4IKF2_DREPO|nr:hypothetical protein DPMN_180388 [Dreissena polymorpha]